MPTIPLTSIKIHRARRQRRNLHNIEELIDSISRLGLINPIVLDRDLRLVAGERRLTALTKLGITELEENVHFRYFSSPDAFLMREVEFDENMKRAELDWPDQCKAVAEYHLDRKSENPDWRIEDTAQRLGVSKQHCARWIDVATAAQKDPTIFEAQKFTVAHNALVRKRERERQTTMSELFSDEPDTPATPLAPAEAKSVEDLAESIDLETTSSPVAPIVNDDCVEYLRAWTGAPFNFLHCDFPYGIDYDKGPRMNSNNKEKYDDSFEVYKNLITSLEDFPIAEHAHMLFWFSPNHWDFTKLTLIRQGWKIHSAPLVWLRSDNSGLIPDPRREGRRVTEFAFHCTRGDRFIVRPKANAIAFPRGDTTHPSIKPAPMLKHFFEMFVDETTRFLDPTCGSATSVKVAENLGAKYVLGIERDPNFYLDACRLWEEEEFSL